MRGEAEVFLTFSCEKLIAAQDLSFLLFRRRRRRHATCDDSDVVDNVDVRR